MRKTLPVEDLARDERFVRVELQERFDDPRPRPGAGENRGKKNRLTPDRPDASHASLLKSRRLSLQQHFLFG